MLTGYDNCHIIATTTVIGAEHEESQPPTDAGRSANSGDVVARRASDDRGGAPGAGRADWLFHRPNASQSPGDEGAGAKDERDADAVRGCNPARGCGGKRAAHFGATSQRRSRSAGGAAVSRSSPVGGGTGRDSPAHSAGRNAPGAEAAALSSRHPPCAVNSWF